MTRKPLGVASIVTALLVLSFAEKGWADRSNDHRENGVNVVTATYGGTTYRVWADSCPAVPSGNVTAQVHDACRGLKICSYLVNVGVLGDPAPGCYKSFSLTYQCAEDSNKTRTVSIGGVYDDANGQTVALSCPL